MYKSDHLFCCNQNEIRNIAEYLAINFISTNILNFIFISAVWFSNIYRTNRKNVSPSDLESKSNKIMCAKRACYTESFHAMYAMLSSFPYVFHSVFWFVKLFFINYILEISVPLAWVRKEQNWINTNTHFVKLALSMNFQNYCIVSFSHSRYMHII